MNTQFNLQELLAPLMALSLKLQRPESSVADGQIWVETTISVIENFCSETDTNSDEYVYYIT